MQRRKSSRIVSSDFPTLGGRNQGTYILQEHGIDVVRGDLITQDNIIPDPYEGGIFTLTINKDNFNQLCTIGFPTGYYDFKPQWPKIGSYQVDDSGIYAESFGSTSYSQHGPMFYVILPLPFGGRNKYWYASMSYNIQNPTSGYIEIDMYVGNVVRLEYQITDATAGEHIQYFYTYNNQYSQYIIGGTSNAAQTITNTLKIYHYQNNTTKAYVGSTKVYDGNDVCTIRDGTNILYMQIIQFTSNSVPYHRVQQITISTDPSYDPQP